MALVPPSAPVLIVGAGPTGLTLAHELLRHGVKPRIIDKAPAISRNPKALGIMGRTLELLTPSGIAAAMMALGVRVSQFHMWSSGRPVAHLDFAKGIEGPYPFILMLPQYMTESVLTGHIGLLGGEVERGIELVSLTQKAEGVEATLRQADGSEEQMWARYLVGCDGAHSGVRHMLGDPFRGTKVPRQFITGNVRMQWAIPHDQAVACINRGHLIAYFPLPNGQHQFLGAVPASQALQGPLSLDEIQREIEICGPPGARASEPNGLGRYHVHQRIVDRYLHQQVLLAGDAAHIQSPLGAQGMNAGIQDAINLAWKLALVVQGQAPRQLLESYESERAKVGARLLREDALLMRQALVCAPLATAARDCIVPWLMRRPRLQTYLTRSAAGLGVSYHRGPLVADYHRTTLSSPLKVGDRAPNGSVFVSSRAEPSQLYELLDGIRHALIVFMPLRHEQRARELRAILAGWGDLITVHFVQRTTPGSTEQTVWCDPDGALAECFGIPDEGLVLIRPDGYVSYRSWPIAVEPLRRYLRAHLTSPPAS